jgi:hypothetical protein
MRSSGQLRNQNLLNDAPTQGDACTAHLDDGTAFARTLHKTKFRTAPDTQHLQALLHTPPAGKIHNPRAGSAA